MADPLTLARAVIAALADYDVAIAHRLAALEPDERALMEARCMAAVGREEEV